MFIFFLVTVFSVITEPASPRHVKLNETFRIRNGETVIVNNALEFKFVGHSHKVQGEQDSPTLIINAMYRDYPFNANEAVPSLFSSSVKPNKKEFTWQMQGYEFIVTDYEYDDWMNVSVKLIQPNK
jgi:hypothetical protein